MKYKWLHSANTKDSLVKDLIIFMGGFGSDPCHFHHLKIYDCDVVMFYDYRDLNTLNSYNTHDIFKNLSYYRHIYLIAFSLGVCVANAMFSSIVSYRKMECSSESPNELSQPSLNPLPTSLLPHPVNIHSPPLLSLAL